MSIEIELDPPGAIPAAKTGPEWEARHDKKRGGSAAPFGYARDFLSNRFVYLTISPRARGLSIGVNMNPDRGCNFDCIYCEVHRAEPSPAEVIDCEAAGAELENTLGLVHGGRIRAYPPYSALPPELISLRHVALSGDGEPTLSPRFLETVETVAHIRALGRFPFFKIVLITNASFLEEPQVQAGLSMFTARDEVWAKLDAGTQAYYEAINRTSVPLEKIHKNILLTARKRPVIIQSLFSEVAGRNPSPEEIKAYAERLLALKEEGANIPMVQIYSATRPTPSSGFKHLTLRGMSEIAATVRQITGLRVEVY